MGSPPLMPKLENLIWPMRSTSSFPPKEPAYGDYERLMGRSPLLIMVIDRNLISIAGKLDT